MLNKVLGTKVGMTQLFDKDGMVVPVTVIDVNHWFVTQVKSSQKDGYASLQLGLLRKRFRGIEFSPVWLKARADHFLRIKEVPVKDDHSFKPGQALSLADSVLQEGDVVSVIGNAKGLGFQGVVKRHGFAGGPKAHGSKFHRRPGSGSHMRTQGEVIKGKRFPGHMGTEQVTVKGLKVIRIDRESGLVFVKGAIPGKKDGLIAINK
jgi:large subunit ribosomal protein L3